MMKTLTTSIDISKYKNKVSSIITLDMIGCLESVLLPCEDLFASWCPLDLYFLIQESLKRKGLLGRSRDEFVEGGDHSTHFSLF